MTGREAEVFVQVEGPAPGKIQTLLAVLADQFLVKHQGRAPGGQAEHGIRLAFDQSGNAAGGEVGSGCGICADDDFHGVV